MISAEKYITNEDNNMIQFRSTSIILLISMIGVFFLYKPNEGCFTFIIFHFICFMTVKNPYLKSECEKGSHIYRAPVNIKHQSLPYEFSAISAWIFCGETEAL